MRRFIAYIIMTLTVFLGISVSFVPTFTKMNSDIDFSGGREYTYRLSAEEGNENNLIEDENAAKDMAGVMEKRLNIAGVSNYKIKIQGNDTVTVKLNLDSEKEYAQVNKYLTFNASFSIATTDDEINYIGDEMFENSTAHITYQGVAPILILPISDTSKFDTLLEHAKELEKTPEGEEGAETTADPSIVLWANRTEGEDLYENKDKNPKVKEKIINVFHAEGIYDPDSENGNSAIRWMFMPATTGEGEQQTTTVNAVTQAYNDCVFYMNLFNAGTIKYEVTSLFHVIAPAGVENLINFGSSETIALSATLIATCVAAVMMTLVLVLFFRLGSISVITCSTLTTFLTFLAFILFGVEFNIAALFGGLLILLMGVFAGVLYNKKFHEEIYKGRSFKKANTEASKKMTLPVIDISVIGVIIGLTTYLLGGAAIASLGVMLIIGSLISVIINTIILKFMMWLLTNTTAFYDKYNLFNIEAKYVPNMLEDNKMEIYDGSFADRDFTSKKKPVAIVSGILLFASLIGLITFGTISGNIYNTGRYYETTTNLYITTDKTSSPIDSIDFVKTNVLANIYAIDKDGNISEDSIKYLDVIHESRKDYNAEDDITTTFNYYVISLDKTFTEEETFSYKMNDKTSNPANLEVCFEDLVGEFDTEATPELRKVEAYGIQPSNSSIFIAAAVSLAVSTVYLLLRYRASRALSVTLLSAASSVIVIGLISLLRIVSGPVTSLSTIGIVVASLMVSLYILIKEKEIQKEQKTRSLSIRNENLVKATSCAVPPILIFLSVLLCVSISYFGFGATTYSLLYGALIIGVSLFVLLLTTLLAPMSNVLEIVISKIRLPKIQIKKKKGNQKKKVKTGEPEEAIFIGIND